MALIRNYLAERDDPTTREACGGFIGRRGTEGGQRPMKGALTAENLAGGSGAGGGAESRPFNFLDLVRRSCLVFVGWI